MTAANIGLLPWHDGLGGLPGQFKSAQPISLNSYLNFWPQQQAVVVSSKLMVSFIKVAVGIALTAFMGSNSDMQHLKRPYTGKATAFQWTNSPTGLDNIVFGVFSEECSDSCIIMYQYDIQENKLFIDTSISFWIVPWGSQLKFSTQITAVQKITTAQKILRLIPGFILASQDNSTSFGCPGCGDGYVLYLETKAHAMTRRFFIDYNTSALKGEVKIFAENLKSLLAEL